MLICMRVNLVYDNDNNKTIVRGCVTFRVYVQCIRCACVRVASVLINRSEHNEKRFSFFYVFIPSLHCTIKVAFFVFVLLLFFHALFPPRRNEKII